MPDTMTDDPQTPAVLNLWAVVGLAASVVVAVVGLFVLPSLRNRGLTFVDAFLIVMGLELLGAFGVTFFALNLYDDVF